MTDTERYLGGPSDRVPAFQETDGTLAQASEFAEQSQFKADGLDLATIWQTLWARRFWILGAGALGLALALGYSLLQTPMYRSTAVLELNPPTIPILSGSGAGDEMSVPSTDWQFLATQYGLLKSRNLARRVVEDLNLASKGGTAIPAQSAAARIEGLTSSLAGSITVTPVPDSRLVELSFVSPSPQEAAQVINGYTEAFLASTLDRKFEATAKAREFLAQRLAATRSELNDSERRLVDYAKANNIIVTNSGGEEGGESSLAGASLVALNAALAQSQQKRIAAEQRYRQAGSITETNQSTVALRQEKAKLETEYREKATFLQDDFPDMVRLRSRIAALDQAIRNEAGQASGSLRAEYQAALAEEGSLRARVQQLTGNVLNEREDSVQYNILQREVDTNRSLYDALLERFNEVGVAGGVSTPQASIVDPGQLPIAPFAPNIPRNLIVGVILGLGLGAALAFAYEMFTDTIKTPDDVREKLRMPALGVIPKKKRKEDLATELADFTTPISESYSSLVTTLQFTTNKGMPQVLLVTSSRAAEGKSTTSFVLASKLAQLGKRVLLVDADMRKPSFVIEERADIGLSRLLTGEGNLSDHVLKTRESELYLLPSGPVPPNPSQLLNSPLTSTIIARLRGHFDHVILDAPPTHGFSDAILLAKASDGVLMVVESGKTRRSLALETIAMLKAANHMVLGVALTKYQAVAGSYGYGNSYRYYDSYRKLAGRSKPHELTPLLYADSEA